jgi:hypothetical protein
MQEQIFRGETTHPPAALGPGSTQPQLHGNGPDVEGAGVQEPRARADMAVGIKYRNSSYDGGLEDLDWQVRSHCTYMSLFIVLFRVVQFEVWLKVWVRNFTHFYEFEKCSSEFGQSSTNF